MLDITGRRRQVNGQEAVFITAAADMLETERNRENSTRELGDTDRDTDRFRLPAEWNLRRWSRLSLLPVSLAGWSPPPPRGGSPGAGPLWGVEGTDRSSRPVRTSVLRPDTSCRAQTRSGETPAGLVLLTDRELR